MTKRLSQGCDLLLKIMENNKGCKQYKYLEVELETEGRDSTDIILKITRNMEHARMCSKWSKKLQFL